MNWDAIGALGEFIGAVAVVASLTYLAIQVRHSTQEEREPAVPANIEHRVWEAPGDLRT